MKLVELKNIYGETIAINPEKIVIVIPDMYNKDILHIFFIGGERVEVKMDFDELIKKLSC